MSGSSWFALAGVALSCLALAVSFVAYRLQAKTAKSDDEKELADQIEAIQQQMAKLGPMPPSGISLAAMANVGNVNAALQALLLRVASLIKTADLRPDWYQNLVLATAALQVGDLASAGPYARSAVDLARAPRDGWDSGSASVAQMVSLSTRGVFHFNRGLDGDEELARADFDAARAVVRESKPMQGPYVTSGQLIELYVRQASWEVDLGHTDAAAALMAQACREWFEIRPPLAQQTVGSLLTTFAASQNMVPAERLLTEEFRTGWADFQRRHPANSAAPSALPDLAALHPIQSPPAARGRLRCPGQTALDRRSGLPRPDGKAEEEPIVGLSAATATRPAGIRGHANPAALLPGAL